MNKFLPQVSVQHCKEALKEAMKYAVEVSINGHSLVAVAKIFGVNKEEINQELERAKKALQLLDEVAIRYHVDMKKEINETMEVYRELKRLAKRR